MDVGRLRTTHTAGLTAEERQAIWELLLTAFDGDVTEHDFEHSLGGMHACVWEGSELVAHGAVVTRRLLHDGRALRTGYVEGVAVRPDRQRQGHGSRLMAELESLVRGGYELGALGSSEIALDFYLRRGWSQWDGTASVLTPTGIERTPEEEGWILVLPVTAQLSPAGELTCDWREGDVW